jgi:hypothetical protein
MSTYLGICGDNWLQKVLKLVSHNLETQTKLLQCLVPLAATFMNMDYGVSLHLHAERNQF